MQIRVWTLFYIFQQLWAFIDADISFRHCGLVGDLCDPGVAPCCYSEHRQLQCVYETFEGEDYSEWTQMTCKSYPQRCESFKPQPMADYIVPKVKWQDRTFGLTQDSIWPISYDENGAWVVLIPYHVEDLEDEVLHELQNTISAFNHNSCIRWVPRSSQEHYVRMRRFPPIPLLDPNSCWSMIGHNEGCYQFISINKECIGYDETNQRLYNIAHEMLHTLNFVHEHQRMDRNCYVRIAVDDDGMSAFDIYEDQRLDESFPYDPQSIMHYPSHNGDIINLLSNWPVGPQSNSPTELDWSKVNYLYCNGPHYCDKYPDACQAHRDIQEACNVTVRHPVPRNLLFPPA